MRYVLRLLCIIIGAVCLMFPLARLIGSQRTDGQIIYRASFEGAYRHHSMRMLDVSSALDVPYPSTRGLDETRRLINTPNLEFSPAFNVYASQSPTARKDPFRLIGVPDACCPIWSADQGWLSYVRNNLEVVIRNLTTGEEHSLASSTTRAWSPDGRWLLYLGGGSSAKTLMLVSSDGQERHHLTQFDVGCATPQWSPLGDQLAFVCYGDGGVDIYVAHSPCHFLPTCETTMRQITHTAENEGSPTWSPDGQWLAYGIAREGATMQLYATHVLSGETRRLTYAATSSYAPRWTLLYAP